jgi:cytoskeletal protein CcmA (bactofilin family)
MLKHTGKRRWLETILAVVAAMLLVGNAVAAQLEDGKTYRLEEGDVVEDDLYVAAEEIFIYGTVHGDLVAAGGTVHVNGTVDEDAILAGADVQVNGQVKDDARIAGASVQVHGTINDDLFVAGGGGEFAFPINLNGRSISPGVTVGEGSEIGGDVFIGAGEGVFEGTVAGDLNASGQIVTLAGTVNQNANLAGQQVHVRHNAQVDGTLAYQSPQEAEIPEDVAANVEYTQTTPQAEGDEQAEEGLASIVLGWLIRTAFVLAGFALLGWLVWKFAPGAVTRPTGALEAQPGKAALYGLVVTLLFTLIPLASIVLVLLLGIFWGWFPGMAMAIFLFSLIALFWVLSPVFTGMWVGRKVMTALGKDVGTLSALLAGMLLLGLVGRIPVLGWIIYLVSFVLALGGLVLLARQRQDRSVPGAA